MYDYIIVGQGLAGSLFAHKCFQNNKTFMVIDPGENNASKVSSGMYNPVVLKRFTPVWNAQQQIDKAQEVFKKIEDLLGKEFLVPLSIHRIFHSLAEQETWLDKSNLTTLEAFLSKDIEFLDKESVRNNFATGKVFNGGKVKVRLFLKEFAAFLKKNKTILNEKIDYKLLNVQKDFVEYKTIKAKQLVFCEGFGLKENPYFKELPLVGNKGETMVIKAPNLKLDKVVKSKVFIMPLEKDHYFIGATYNFNDKDEIPTEEGKEELSSKLKMILNVDFEVVKHRAGIRPTVIDRRPLVGRHKKYSNLYVLNGLGTRGIMLGCTMVDELYNLIENNKELTREVNINRFISS